MYYTIEDVKKMTVGELCTVRCMVVKKERLPKRGNGEYIMLTLQDKTGTIDMPVWENIDTCDDVTNIGDKLIVEGKRGEFDKTPQIQKITVNVCEEELPASEFIPSYNVPSELFKYFSEYILKIKDLRYTSLLEYILGARFFKIDDKPAMSVMDENKWKAFVTAPSASRHHGNKLSGLFLHTIGVMRAVDNMIADYVEKPLYIKAEKKHLDVDRLRFLAILHDYDKINEYEWEYQIKRKESMAVGHEVLFIETLSEANKECGNLFTKEELSVMYFIILTHHGKWSKYQPGSKDKVWLESKLLHCADMIDSQIVGEIEGSH